jgi:hypothetical protein
MSTSPTQQPTPDPVQHVMQLCLGFLASAALRAALECKVADHLAGGPKPVSELARLAHANEDALYRTVRALASAGIFTEVAPRVFANTPASDVLRQDHPANMHNMFLWISDRFHFEVYAHFPHSVKTGQPAVEKSHGVKCFDYFPTDKETNDEFNHAMTSLSAMVIPQVLETYDFSGLGTLCDVAGGHGFVLTSILEKHKDLKGILFDLDHVLEGGKQRIDKMGLASRCTTASGDFFESVPAADSYVMKHIIHDWDDEKSLTILRNIHKAMRGNGKVILLEAIVPPMNEPHFAKWLDLEMLALPGGKERTEAEYRDLLGRAGFKLTRVVPNKSPLCTIEAVKA